MKKKVWIYIGIIFGLVWGYDALVSSALRQSQFGEFRKLTHILEEEMEADILIIGSSRAELCFDPALLKAPEGHSIYNTGLVGTNLHVTHAGLQQRLALGHKIHTVVLITDFFLWQDPDIENFTDAPRFIPYLRNNVFYTHLAKGHPKAHFIKWLPPYSATYWNDRYLYNAWRSYANTPIKVDTGTNPETGYRILPDEHAVDFNSPVESKKDWLSQSELEALDAIYATCKTNNIRIVTIVPPVHGDKLERLNNTAAWNEMVDRSKTNNSTLYDYTNWPYENDSTVFFDDIHLNPKGVRLFMKDFQKDLDGLFP